jgi:RsiW-degrading membrane proteinase PrsW (M82 family)
VNEPTRRDRLKPVELIVISAILSGFVGLVVLMVTREFLMAGVFFGVAFIVTLVVMAMLSLSIKPNDREQLEIDRDDEQPAGH